MHFPVMAGETFVPRKNCYTRRNLISFYIIADIYFFSIRQHKTQNSFSFLLTKHGQGNGGVLKNKNQNRKSKQMTPQFELRREDFNA